ncbi:hypothetical protein H8F10_00190 [Vibrio fluvialis]|uniref:hypothetical protein n=1 Tax=Vibrio fluvialis TaxID=676 RepID=UPI00192B68F9|nr:hypothetical protein [Vibrio fluvialis]EKO3965395.1 hypothetical protein [Vibrio fluvialis]MBL4276328.1 hypothetical protein [Vibrio fluvialis]
MKNTLSNDYQAGLTTPLVNPNTGKTVAGAAARNIRLKDLGASGYAAHAVVEAMKPVELMMGELQSTLAMNNAIITSLASENKELRKEINRLKS